jgi:hypothetical protein
VVGEETPVDDPGKVPLEASHCVIVALAGLPFPFEICAGTSIVTDLGECDRVYRSVELAVAPSVQSPPIGLARRVRVFQSPE